MEKTLQQWYLTLQGLEKKFWSSLSTTQVKVLTDTGYNVNNMSFYGEIVFLLCGLKACVIFSGLTTELRDKYTQIVIHQSGLLNLNNDQLTLELHKIPNGVRSVNFELSDSAILINRSHKFGGEALVLLIIIFNISRNIL